MIQNMTKLQKQIMKIIKGHEVSEVIHAFEVIKIDVLLYKITKK